MLGRFAVGLGFHCLGGGDVDVLGAPDDVRGVDGGAELLVLPDRNDADGVTEGFCVWREVIFCLDEQAALIFRIIDDDVAVARRSDERQAVGNAIEHRTGISRPNARKAVNDLLARGIWKRTRDGKHPIYEAVPGNLVPGGPFTAAEQAAIAAVRSRGTVPSEANDAIKALKARGIICERSERYSNHRQHTSLELDEAAVAALTEPLAVWLPNALIDGAANEVPPVELIRQTRSHAALRLLVELYSEQFLPNYGGVPRDLLKGVFDRAKVGEQGPFLVWGFRSKHMTADAKMCRPFYTGKLATKDDGTRHDSSWFESFWPAVHTLADIGLVEKVGMLLDGDDAEAEIIHPYAMRDGELAERELAAAASSVAGMMVTQAQLMWSQENGYHLVPVRKHIVNAAVVEVFRLKYRPHTSATAAWYAVMRDTVAKYLAEYQAMMKGVAAAANGQMQYQG